MTMRLKLNDYFQSVLAGKGNFEAISGAKPQKHNPDLSEFFTAMVLRYFWCWYFRSIINLTD